MKSLAKVGLSLAAGVAVAPWFPLVGQETVTVQREPTLLPTAPVAEAEEEAPAEPWLGVYVSPPPAVVYAQVPKVPRGAGFVVERVVEGGPAEAAGVQQYDLLWKLDDQWLMNESQYIKLLDLRKVGEVVRLTYYRGGENHEVEAVLAGRPEDERGMAHADEHVMTQRIPGMPTLEVRHLQQTAVLRDGKETVRVQRVKGRFKWASFDGFGLELASGELDGADPEDFPPELEQPMQRKLMVLVRSLENDVQREQRGPRVRRLPGSK